MGCRTQWSGARGELHFSVVVCAVFFSKHVVIQCCIDWAIRADRLLKGLINVENYRKRQYMYLSIGWSRKCALAHFREFLGR